MTSRSAARAKDGAVQIRYLDGLRLRRAVLAGIRRLQERREQLNSINVYPVPDADTGTNMVLTMASAAERLRRQPLRSVADTSQTLAESAILGSQGNSGAILAQFLKGLADGLRGRVRVSTQDFAEAVSRARTSAYSAIAKPREGTILTVIKDWSEYIHASPKDSGDFAVLLRSALARAKESLRHTPEQLEVLREHGVVDAGAQGFVHLLEGITDFVETGDLRAPEGSREVMAEAAPSQPFVYSHRKVDLAYRFCTECVVRTQGEVPPDRVRELLETMGDSLVVVSGDSLFKVHLHTNEPLRMYEVLSTLGTLTSKKCDDMQYQQEGALADPATVAIVTDSACDLPMEYIRRNFISIVPLKLLFGDEVFLDKIEISPAEFLRKCRRSTHHPTTSQPSVQDYLKSYDEAGSRKPEILVVCLSGAISGTFQAAQAAASQYSGAPVQVFDSRTVTVAQGLLVQHARTLALAGEDAASIAAKLEVIKRRAKVFVSLKTLEFLRRGGRISSSRSLVATLLNIRPVISLSEDGKVFSPTKAWGRFGVRRKVLQMARQEWEKYKRFQVAVAHVDAPKEADYYVSRIEKLTGLKDIPVVEATAVLGAHAGPGAAGIAVLGLE